MDMMVCFYQLHSLQRKNKYETKTYTFAMEYEYDSQTISPQNRSCQHCNGNASVHFVISLLTVNCQLSTVTWIHTFSAKEKDSETGLSYFGSRYYSSDLSIWLSMDPMSDKYPSLSPYVYCANNPVKLVDPNGEDIITIHRDGSYSIKEKKGRDVLVSTESLRIKRLSAQGVFREHVSQEMKENEEGKMVPDKTTFTGLGKDDAQTIFNFLGDHTQVEWGYLESENPDGSRSYFVGSSHNEDEEPLVSSMTYDNIKVLRYDHSHRMRRHDDLEAHRYSTKDMDFWNDLISNHPSATAGIRVGGKTTIYYKNGVKTDAYSNPLNLPK